MNKRYRYNDLYKKYDMQGEIHVGSGILKVHDIFNPLPEFMKQADTIFCDAPCSKANINAFYTKAELTAYQESYEPFCKRFFDVLDEISPRFVFLEVFKSNKERFIQECNNRYSNVEVYESMYYHHPKNKCWIIQASNEPLQQLKMNGIDEEDAIELICKNADYDCIGDPCIGKGLVAYYANSHGKKFVGTELNKYRLAVAVDRVITNKRGKFN